MKTVIKALIDEVHWPIPPGFAENICIRRGLDACEEISWQVMDSVNYKGALADCLCSLLQAINFSEAGMSVGNLSDAQRKAILKKANKLYAEIGEEEVEDEANPTVYINC